MYWIINSCTLLPKKGKYFIQPTADKLGCDPVLVADVSGFYFQELPKALVEMRHNNIQVTNFGSFRAKNNKLPELIKGYQNHIASIKTETFNQMGIKRELEIRLERTLKLQKKIADEKFRRAEFTKWKREQD